MVSFQAQIRLHYHMGHLEYQEGALGALFVTLQALVGLVEVQCTWHLCWNVLIVGHGFSTKKWPCEHMCTML